MQKITPFLWFDGNVEEAVHFYTGIFKNSKVLSAMPGPGGTMMSATLLLNGQELIAFNGGPMFKFTEAISLMVSCESQEEIDGFWEKLSEGGEKSRCGWLKDKFGLSWQVVPPLLVRLLNDKDPAKAKRVMTAMLQMNKIIIADLEKAYDGA
jgi:predicted 3-demethylubiquinone-9 3-methyltransferase (glyoxalase superfamily)